MAMNEDWNCGHDVFLSFFSMCFSDLRCCDLSSEGSGASWGFK